MKHRDSPEVDIAPPADLPAITLSATPGPGPSLDTERVIASVESGLDESRPAEEMQIRLTAEDIEAHYRRAR